MTLKKIYVIANPGAGSRCARALASALELLKKHVETELLETEFPGHATTLAQTHGQDPDSLIAVCGGDGTICEALNGLPPEGVLGILPGGTANVVARELGIPLDLREAAKALLTGAIKELDVGRLENPKSAAGKKYLMVAGFGLDAYVAGKVPPLFKKVLGQYAYHLEVFKQFPGYKPPRISVWVDGMGPYHGTFAILANMRRYGGNLFFAPGARYDDGRLDLILFRKFSFGVLFRGAGAAWLRHGVSEDLAYRLQGREFRFSFSKSTPFQLDGEFFTAIDEATVSCQPASLRMVTP